jgi:hypothetical protein
MDVAQTIIERTTSAVEELHYSSAKTIVMIILSDNDKAKKLHTEALNAFLPIAADAAKEGDSYPSSVATVAAIVTLINFFV